jgi:MFS family permease
VSADPVAQRCAGSSDDCRAHPLQSRALGEGLSSSGPAWRTWAAAWIVLASMILSNAPTPLYTRWQSEIGFSSSILTTIFGVYTVGLLLTLLIAGQLTVRWGSKRLLIASLGVAMTSSLLFAYAGSVPTLLAARFTAGIAVGIALSTGMACVIGSGGQLRRRLTSRVASGAMALGTALGPLLAGAMIRIASEPIAALFLIELSILFVAALVVVLLPLPSGSTETHQRSLFVLPRISRQNRQHLVCGIAHFGSGMAGTAFMLSLGPSVLADLLGVSSPLVAGGMAGAMMLAASVVPFLAARRSVPGLFRLSTGAAVTSMAVLVCAVVTASAYAFLAAAVLVGASAGLGQVGGVTLIGSHVPDDRRTEAIAVLNMGAYVLVGVMPIATGVVVDRIGLPAGTIAFAICLAIGATLAHSFASYRRY